MSEKKMVRRSVVIALGMVCIVLMAALVGFFAYHVLTTSDKNNTNSSTGTLSSASYTVGKVGNYWVAQNGTTNDIDFNDTDSYTVIQSCIDNLTSNIEGTNGGTIILTSGSPLLTQQLVISNPYITLEGHGRATGLSATFNGSLIQIVSRNKPANATCVTIKNLLFYNDNPNLNQTAIYLNTSTSSPALYYVKIEQLFIICMNGITTDAGIKGTDTQVLLGNLISDIIIENAPEFGIELWTTLDMTINNVFITWDRLGPTTPVAGTTGIRITMNGESAGIIITNTRVLRADYGITLKDIKDVLITNTISDLCKTWAWNLDGANDCLLTNVYGTSRNGTAFWLNGNSSQNRITSSTFHDSDYGVKDDTTNTNYFTATISDRNSQDNWKLNQYDSLINCNH